ncbi:MAG: hypothetical protein JWO06_890 [Bacteroidota bacterium]|nr:hypothetical protein [Bacteroidota bacterium]
MIRLHKILRSNSYILLSIFFLTSCNTSSKKDAANTGVNKDTVSRISKIDSTLVSKKNESLVDTIIISDMNFHPAVIKIHKGDAVIWINKDMVTHCVTEAKTKSWSSLQIPAGEAWKMMAVEHSSDYYCAIHLVMKGKIVVEKEHSASKIRSGIPGNSKF